MADLPLDPLRRAIEGEYDLPDELRTAIRISLTALIDLHARHERAIKNLVGLSNAIGDRAYRTMVHQAPTAAKRWEGRGFARCSDILAHAITWILKDVERDDREPSE